MGLWNNLNIVLYLNYNGIILKYILIIKSRHLAYLPKLLFENLVINLYNKQLLIAINTINIQYNWNIFGT